MVTTSRVKISDCIAAVLGGHDVVPLAHLPAGSMWTRTYVDGDEMVTEYVEPSTITVDIIVGDRGGKPEKPRIRYFGHYARFLGLGWVCEGGACIGLGDTAEMSYQHWLYARTGRSANK